MRHRIPSPRPPPGDCVNPALKYCCFASNIWLHLISFASFSFCRCLLYLLLAFNEFDLQACNCLLVCRHFSWLLTDDLLLAMNTVLQRIAYNVLYVQNCTSCCSTDSKRPHSPHCCCHLLNNFGTHRIFTIIQNGSGHAPPQIENCSFPCGIQAEHILIHGSLGPPEYTP